MSEDRPLTDAEAALVFRRATELEVELSRRREGWDLAQLEAVGREVGISADAVRLAVAEVRLGPPSSVGTGPVVRCVRIVPVTSAAAHAALRTWLEEQLFEAVRDRDGVTVMERRTDPDAIRRRHRDHAGRFRLRPFDRVTVAVGAVPGGGSAIRVEATLATARLRRTTGRAAGVVPIVWSTGAVVTAVTPVGLEHLWLATPALAAGATWWSWRRAGRAEGADIAAGTVAIEGALDRLDGQDPQ